MAVREDDVAAGEGAVATGFAEEDAGEVDGAAVSDAAEIVKNW